MARGEGGGGFGSVCLIQDGEAGFRLFMAE